MLEIVKTADGSNTVFNSEVGENYHSRHGALQESRHVFLKSGLEYFLAKESKTSTTGKDLEGAVSILEVGFGTGLNFLLTADYCTAENIRLNYTGIEAYPLTEEMISQTGYDEYVSADTWKQFLANYKFSIQNPIELNKNCRLKIAHTELMRFQSGEKFDVIYFDAFAAIHQPEMWDEAAITHTLQFLKPGGVFVTYAITGNLKRIVKSLGLKVEKAPGAPGKREMLRAY
jgi:tRNA U34 5-methylaminomethyl-2-thiouridine-forming methyltransferase MnmC